jgi:cation diffusion facilitator family transporter
MAIHDHANDGLDHSHFFLGAEHAANEKRMLAVVVLTCVMMIGEIVGGLMFRSIGLVADGLHMSTHAAALGVSAFAYWYARRHANDPRFAFGTGKVGDLAAFTSGLALAMVAVFIAYEAINRFFSPQPIAYVEALVLATLGLCVNIASAWLLRGDHHGHGHSHGHGHDHDHSPGAQAHDRDHNHAHDHGDQDLNLRSAYVHVIADAAVSLLVIGALLFARAFGWVWLDPLVGFIGSAVIVSWAYGLLRDAGSVLLDMTPDEKMKDAIRTRLETNGDYVSDLHLWRVGPGHRAAMVSLVSSNPRPAEAHKAALADLPGLSHVTIEVLTCPQRH